MASAKGGAAEKSEPSGMLARAWADWGAVAGWCAAVALAVALAGVMSGGSACDDDALGAAGKYYLAANADTVHWGYYSKTLEPAITIKSGDSITVEMLTHHAGDYYAGMIAGDAGVMSVYNFHGAGIPGTSTTPGHTPSAAMRGATGNGDGVHILTGPIAVEGAEPGDVIAVTINDLRPRINPATGKTYGINAAAWWGYNFGVNGPAAGGDFGKGSASGMAYDTPTPGPAFSQVGFSGGAYQREMTTVYEIVTDPDTGAALYAEPALQFQYGLNGSVTTPCTAAGGATFSPGVQVACNAGAMNWLGYQFPGLITDHSKTVKDVSVAGKWQVPINFHIGSIGLAPAAPSFVDSVPPRPTGGNIDDRRIGIGATLYLPVEVAGGLLSMGDAHTAQGDSELDGTGIETHITGDFTIELIKAGPAMPSFLAGLNMPLLENDNEYIIHSFTFIDYLTELGYADEACDGTGVSFLGGTSTFNPTGCPTDNIYFLSAIEPAVANTHKQARDFLMRMGYDEDAATSMITLAGDFGTTQIVDGNWGVQVNIPKYILNQQTEPYTQSVSCGGSIPATSAPDVPAGCSATGCDYYLAANASTINWGLYSRTLSPAISVMSGKTIGVEMLSHHAGDYYEGMIQGDAGITSIYQWGINGAGTPPGVTAATHMRGASGGGDGVHILTGPIYVSDSAGPAQPGDVIKVDVLSLKPRPNPAGKTFGINAAAWWGYHYGVNGPLARHWSSTSTVFPSDSQTGYVTGDPDREVANVYEIITDPATGNALYAEPAFRFTYGTNTRVPCVAGGAVTGFSPGLTVPCVNGFQSFPMYNYPGVITQHPTGTEDYSVAGAWQIPVNFHIGSMGLAPAAPAFVNSIPPMVGGGNMDDRRLGVGATMYLKVAVTGGLLSMGDAHAAQGDSELDGTGIETHVNGQFRITLIRAGSGSATVPAPVLANLNFPLLENANEFVVHSFTDVDWLSAKNLTNSNCDGTAFAALGGTSTYNPLGCPNSAYLAAGAPCGSHSEVFCTSSTDDAVANTYHQARKFVTAMTGLSESNAVSLLTVGADIGLTQIVDGNFGAHYVIPKYMLSGNEREAYVQATMCKTSMPGTWA